MYIYTYIRKIINIPFHRIAFFKKGIANNNFIFNSSNYILYYSRREIIISYSFFFAEFLIFILNYLWLEGLNIIIKM